MEANVPQPWQLVVQGGGAVAGRIWGHVTKGHPRQEMPPATKYLAGSFCVILSKFCLHSYSALQQQALYKC